MCWRVCPLEMTPPASSGRGGGGGKVSPVLSVYMLGLQKLPTTLPLSSDREESSALSPLYTLAKGRQPRRSPKGGHGGAALRSEGARSHVL
jgi:hypothetical protein